jgi:hypothetical protein
LTLSIALLITAACLARAADETPAVQTAQGVVDKVEKDTLTVKPRAKDGRFEKTLVLQITGTSKISTLTTQTRAQKTVVVQKDTEAKDLQPNQPIALIYATSNNGMVLLAAVVQPAK